MKLRKVVQILEDLLREDWTDPIVDVNKYEKELRNMIEDICQDNYRLSSDLNQEEKNLVDTSESLIPAAIKVYRARTNQSLRTAYLRVQEYKKRRISQKKI